MINADSGLVDLSFSCYTVHSTPLMDRGRWTDIVLDDLNLTWSGSSLARGVALKIKTNVSSR